MVYEYDAVEKCGGNEITVRKYYTSFKRLKFHIDHCLQEFLDKDENFVAYGEIHEIWNAKKAKIWETFLQGTPKGSNKVNVQTRSTSKWKFSVRIIFSFYFSFSFYIFDFHLLFQLVMLFHVHIHIYIIRTQIYTMQWEAY